MGADLTPYLSFRGEAREAMEFYTRVFGGELTLNTFADFGGMGVPEEEQGQVMHSQIAVDGKVTLMGADTPSSMPYAPAAGVTLALSGDDEPKLRGWWDALSDGADVSMPMELAPWGDYYGQLTDRFGTPWMVNASGPGDAA